MILWSPRKNNCFTWAIVMWWRYGGRPQLGGSLYGYWPHVYWIYEGRKYEYAPKAHIEGLKRPPSWFYGHPQEVINETVTRIVRVRGQLKTDRIIR